MPKELDLTDDTTPEEMQEYISDVVKDVEEIHEGNRRDGQRLAEDGDEPVTQPAAGGDDPPGGDPPPTEEGGDDDDSGGQDWIDDDLKAEATAYGIDEQELADFTSREEFDRAVRFLDRNALKAGKEAMAEGDGEGRARDEQGRFQKKPEGDPDEGEPEPKPREGQYEVKLSKERWEDDIVDEFERMRDHYEDRLSVLEARDAEREIKAEEARFDAIVDSLGHADLFGKTGKETRAQLDRREDLLVQVKAYQIGMKQMGRPADLGKSLVERTAKMAFAEDFTKKEIKARTKKLSEQSDRRQGGTATIGSPEPKETLREEMRRLHAELEKQ